MKPDPPPAESYKRYASRWSEKPHIWKTSGTWWGRSKCNLHPSPTKRLAFDFAASIYRPVNKDSS